MLLIKIDRMKYRPKKIPNNIPREVFAGFGQPINIELKLLRSSARMFVLK